MNHFIRKCSECTKVVAQCKCWNESKSTEYGICEDCKPIESEHPDIGKRVYGCNNKLFEKEPGVLMKREGLRFLIKLDTLGLVWFGSYEIIGEDQPVHVNEAIKHLEEVHGLSSPTDEKGVEEPESESQNALILEAIKGLNKERAILAERLGCLTGNATIPIRGRLGEIDSQIKKLLNIKS